MRAFPLTAALLLAAAAAPAFAKSNDSMHRTLYSCADNQTLDVTYVNTAGGTSYAIVLEQDELLPMNQMPSGSGAIYRAADPNYNYQLLTKGKTADLIATTNGKEDPVKTDCTAN